MSNLSTNDVQNQIHQQICSHLSKVEEWFWEKSENLFFPFYSSFDIRDSCQKIAPVDANIFPAGFNNICQMDKDHASQAMEFYLNQEYKGSIQNIVLLSEEHTKNVFYWENIYTLISMLEEAGYSAKVAFPKDMDTSLTVQSYSGKSLQVYGAQRKGDNLLVDGQTPDLIICNNDFSNANEDLTKNLNCPMNPPYKLGWHQRKKSHFFKHYNRLSTEFAELLHLDPSVFNIETEVFSGLDISSESSRQVLAEEVDSFLEKRRSQNPESEPFVFIKNNSGTYGLGIIQAHSGDDVRQLNYKSRKTMKAVKGGGEISEVIIQEGVPSVMVSGDETAEPTIYTIGSRLIGGFLRAHSKKGPKENLNSPGAIYKRLCITDLQVDVMGLPMENVYGWAAKLGALAIANEIKDYE